MNLFTLSKEHLLGKWAHVLEQTKHIRTFTADAELAWLAEYATWSSNMLEIGSWRGRSAKVMLMANQGLRITCLDTWDDAGTFEEFTHNLGPEIAAGRVTYKMGPSQESLEGSFFDLFDACFIDGAHEEHLVKADIEGTIPLMKPRSIMAGHDYASNGGPNDVARGVLSIGRAVQRPMDSIWTIQL
jgi:predicted O-methyltransferase YrrM